MECVRDKFEIKVYISQKSATRRRILSMTHSLFDPLGFVAPVLLELKWLLRELSNRDWDESILENKVTRWKNCYHSLTIWKMCYFLDILVRPDAVETIANFITSLMHLESRMEL